MSQPKYKVGTIVIDKFGITGVILGIGTDRYTVFLFAKVNTPHNTTFRFHQLEELSGLKCIHPNELAKVWFNL